jgi:DNA ligase 1
VKSFAALYDAIDTTTATNEKVAAVAAYLRAAPPDDAAWAVSFLIGRRPSRLVKSGDLRRWAAAAADVPDWLFEECYAQAGDLSETITLLAPRATRTLDVPDRLTTWVTQVILPLAGAESAHQEQVLREAWDTLDGIARFVFNKLITGAFRVGVSHGLVVRALAEVSGVDADAISHRLMGQWTPSAEWFATLVHPETSDADWSRPYPFCLAHPLDAAPASLGDVTDWQAEWKWDGIRAQVIVRRGRVMIWSRGEELLAGRFPEIEMAAGFLPDGTVLDGEILAWGDDAPRSFQDLQTRINRKTVSAKLLRDLPCRLLVYDVLEQAGADMRSSPLAERRVHVESLVAALPTGAAIGVSPMVPATTWDDLVTAREAARAQRAEGLMLKRRASVYGVGRKVGDWWKWKVVPYTVDAVLVYAQAGHGRRAGLFTDYTFAVWDGDALVPFSKAYSGLTDAEIRSVDRFVRQHTLETFGPVRTVTPELVFEIAFEGMQLSTRHKSGIAVRFPRISRWRTDKTAREADTLTTIRAMLRAQGGA